MATGYRLEQFEQAVPVSETRGIPICKANTEFGFQCGNFLGQIEGLDDTAPLLGRQRCHHEAHAVLRLHVTSEGTPDGIAQPLSITATKEHFRHRPGICQCPHGDIAKGDADFRAFTGGFAVTKRRQQGEGTIGPGEEVPRRHQLVDRLGTRRIPFCGAGHQRITAGGIHGEIHCLAPVVPAHDPHRNHLLAAIAHRGMAEEALLRQVGDTLACVARQFDA